MLPSEDKNEHDTNIHHRIPRDAPPKPATTPEDRDDDEPDPMMESVTSIFVLEEEKSEEEGEGEGEVVDVEDRKKRLDRLKTLKLTLEQLWWSNSNYMAAAAEKLADGSRDPKWRVPLGEAGIVDFFLSIVNLQGLDKTLKVHVLRIIGNSCADTDSNRERVVSHNHLPGIIRQLKETPFLPFVIPVIHNICVDYEPAQKQASEAGLSKELIELASSPRFGESRAFLGYICRLLDLMVVQPGELERAPENIATVLFNLAVEREALDLDDFLALIGSAILYLEHERFQKALVKHSSLDVILTLMMDSYTRFDESSAAIAYPSGGRPPVDQDEARLLSQMRDTVNVVLSDVSALSEFAAAYPINSPIAASLRRWISSPQKQLQVCACIMLGNLARSDRVCEEFVHSSAVHRPLISVLSNTDDSQLLHAALGFLKNLALPARNKQPLGDAGLVAILPRLWKLETLPQIQYNSISLARQLIIGSYPNVRRLCSRLSEDPDSPAYARSQISVLTSIFVKSDAEPIKMEIARLLTAICRVYCSPETQLPSPESTRMSFFERHPDIGRPLSYMVAQKKWPVVRSEGWFVFAIMARTPEGARCVEDLMHDFAVFQPLVELLTGKSITDVSSKNEAMSPMTAYYNAMNHNSARPSSRSSANYPYNNGSANVGQSPGGNSYTLSPATSPTYSGSSPSAMMPPPPINTATSPSASGGHFGNNNGASPSPSTASTSSPQHTRILSAASASMPPPPLPSHPSMPSPPNTNPEPSGMSPEDTEKMARIDRENALVLVSELLKNCGEHMAVMRRHVFEELLRGGGTMHLDQREIRERSEMFDKSDGGSLRPGFVRRGSGVRLRSLGGRDVEMEG